MIEDREFFYPNPGKIDLDGVEWWRTDGSSSWYRWENGKLRTNRRPRWPRWMRDFETSSR